jgi:hypothetical protein
MNIIIAFANDCLFRITEIFVEQTWTLYNEIANQINGFRSQDVSPQREWLLLCSR